MVRICISQIHFPLALKKVRNFDLKLKCKYMSTLQSHRCLIQSTPYLIHGIRYQMVASTSGMLAGQPFTEWDLNNGFRRLYQLGTEAFECRMAFNLIPFNLHGVMVVVLC